MGLLDSIFESDAVKNAAFSMLKKHCKNTGCSLIVVQYDAATDQFNFHTHQASDQPVIVPYSQLAEMERQLMEAKALTNQTNPHDSNHDQPEQPGHIDLV